ncbi:MAG: BspA family leucine-rich repeat surface protein [Bacteroidota bacterium]
MRNQLFLTWIIISVLLTSCSSDDDPSPSNNENAAPIITAQSFSADEDIADDVVIGTVQATDTEGDSLTFSITANSGNLFEITASGELSLTTNESLDFETAVSHMLTVEVSDGTSQASASITITVNDVKGDNPFTFTWTPIDGGNFGMPGVFAGIIGGASTIDGNTLSYDFTVDWGDGSMPERFTSIANVNHEYTSGGNYQVKITGELPHVQLGLPFFSLVKTIDNWGEIEWEYLLGSFQENPDLQVLATDVPNLSNATILSNMFLNCLSLNTGNFNEWDMRNVTLTVGMFSGCRAFNQPLDNWDMSNVISTRDMFLDARDFNQDIGSWDVSKVTDFSNMFASAANFNQDIGNWDLSGATGINGTLGMFFSASAFNQDISGWNMINVRNMRSMFHFATNFNQDISGWNVGEVTDMESMFQSASSFSQNLSSWDVGQVAACTGFAGGSSVLSSSQLPNFTNCTP